MIQSIHFVPPPAYLRGQVSCSFLLYSPCEPMPILGHSSRPRRCTTVPVPVPVPLLDALRLQLDPCSQPVHGGLVRKVLVLRPALVICLGAHGPASGVVSGEERLVVEDVVDTLAQVGLGFVFGPGCVGNRGWLGWARGAGLEGLEAFDCVWRKQRVSPRRSEETPQTRRGLSIVIESR